MNLLLIGTGYVGLALLQSWQGPQFTTLTTTPSKLEVLAPYQPTLLEIKQNTDLSSLFSKVDGVIITAAKKTSRSYEESYLHIAKAVKKSLKNRKKPFYLLYTSSTGAIHNPILKETEDTYQSIENASVCILRLGGIYGPGRTLKARAEMLAKRGLSGTGEEVTNHIHLDDILGAIRFCTEKRLTGLYNLVNDDHPKRHELYQALSEKYNLPLLHLTGDVPSRMITNQIFSNEALRQKGFKFKHPKLIE